MVFPALARMVEFWWNGNALRTCELGRRKGLGRRSGGVGIGAVNRDETEGLGAVGVNPVAATEGLKPLERLGPTQMERSDNIAIPLCESVRDGVEGNVTPAVTVSRLRSPSEEVSGTKWTTLPERMRRASKDSRRSLTSSAGLVRTQWSKSVMESVHVLPMGSGEPRFSSRQACEAWMNEPLPDRHCGSGR